MAQQEAIAACAAITLPDGRQMELAVALDLCAPATESSRPAGITDLRVGITQGRAWAGAFGSATRRSYEVQGDEVNLAAV